MKTGIGSRIAALCTALVVLTGAVVTYCSDRHTQHLLVGQEWVNLRDDVRDDAAHLEAALTALRADVNFLTIRRLTQRFTGAIPPPANNKQVDINEILEHSFEETLRFKPQYVQMRLITREDGGREVVRVRRNFAAKDRPAVRIATAQPLEKVGHHVYVREALALPRGEVYLSDVSIEPATDQKDGPRLAVLHASAPVYKGEGSEVYGVVVIDVDFDQLLKPITEKTRSTDEKPARTHGQRQTRRFVSDHDGEVLARPEQGQVVRADAEGPVEWLQDRDHFLGSDVLAASEGGAHAIEPANNAGQWAGWFQRVELDRSGRSLGLAVVTPYPRLEERAASGRGNMLWVALALIAAAAGLALLFTQVLVRPLHKITRAAESVARGSNGVSLPLDAHGEIGVLARAFQDMAEQVRRRQQELVQVNEELERRVGERTAALQKALEHLEAARDQALEASRAKSAFLTQMNHELRQPLTAIIGFGEMLQEELTDRGADDLLPDTGKILRASRHMLDLINDILDLAKLEANKIELCPKDFDLAGLIHDVVATAEPLARRRGNTLAVQHPADLGPMHADRTRLHQVLLNLLSNACKFTDKGTITLEVLREDSDGQDWLVFQVHDTGIGMTAEQMSRLFQPFSQVDASTARRHEGAGLGLAISRRLCQMMGGTLTVQSEVGKGSTFTARLPVRAGLRAAETAAPSGAPVAEMPPAGAETVLVIDDDPAVRELMQRFLRREGFAVVVAASGEEGLRLAREVKPRAITLDVMMPGMDGWSVLAALKCDPELADIPVVVLTIVEERKLGHALGAADYLTKPIDWERLASVLQRYHKDQARPTILVVESDSAIRRHMAGALEEEGWAVREAASGTAALQSIAEALPALIVLDLLAPEADCFEFLAELQRHATWRAIPVIALTKRDPAPEENLYLNGSLLLSGCLRRVPGQESFNLDELLREVRDLVRDRMKNGQTARVAVTAS
jgi:signal transduction histidine kinase/DNA-binding response OmpR family regulator